MGVISASPFVVIYAASQVIAFRANGTGIAIINNDIFRGFRKRF